MKSCDTCKTVIDDGGAFCPRCGRPVLVDVPADVETGVRGLLAEANLHRIRGEHGEAIDKCTEALQLNSCDPETHSLLGDIYDSQGKLDEAARWYQMAIELRPSCAVDEAKLNRVRQRLTVIQRAERSLTTTGSWTRTFLGGSRIDTAMRFVVVFSVAALLVLFAIGLFAWFGRDRTADAPVQPGSRPNATNQPQPTGPSSVPVDPEPTNELLVRPMAEQQVLSNLATNPVISNRRLIVEDVKIDPRRLDLLVTVRSSESVGNLTQLRLLRDSAVVGAAAFAASSDARVVTVRMLAQVPSEAGVSEPHLLLVCDVPRQASSLDIRAATADQLSQLISNVWWSRAVGGEGPGTGGR